MEETRTLEAGTVEEFLTEASSKELNPELFQEIAAYAFDMGKAFDELSSMLNDWDRVAKKMAGKEVSNIFRGYCSLIAGNAEEAVEILKGTKRNPWGCYYLARALMEVNQPDKAYEVAEDAREKYPECDDLPYLVIEFCCRLNRTDEAVALLEKRKKEDDGTTRYLFHEARVLENRGEYADAIQSYRRVIEKDGRHTEALFRLGYLLEIYGTDADEANDEAVSAYETCVRIPPVHTKAVLNLGLLYEDRERYHDAIKCYETVLRRFPNHDRAKLFLKDALASTEMFYDKDQEKRADKQSQVLKIPVSDFELSVRSRNCLQKMNIQTLGDLIMKTEQELLSYKNFGETSLAEIKDMLGQKGLHLGQGLESRGGDAATGRNPLEATAPPDTLDKPIDDLNLSVRSRRCMERLEVRTIRELINKTEVELMSAKNFGMTSLNEIKRKLGDLGLSLRS